MEKDKRQKALDELYKQTSELYDSYESKEDFWNDQHWINNPLINPSDKVRMLKGQGEAEFKRGREYERELIRKRLREEIKANQEERASIDNSEERSHLFMFIAGMHMALMVTKWVEHVETE